MEELKQGMEKENFRSRKKEERDSLDERLKGSIEKARYKIGTKEQKEEEKKVW